MRRETERTKGNGADILPAPPSVLFLLEEA
jgi:hypothetical protein